MERIRILLKSQAISLKESVRSALLDSEAKLDRIFIHKYPSRFFERNLEALYVQNPHLSKNLSDFRPGGGPLIPCQIRRHYGWTRVPGKDGVAAENRGLIPFVPKLNLKNLLPHGIISHCGGDPPSSLFARTRLQRLPRCS